MKKLLHGFAALPFLASTALAQPMPLTDSQMDRVAAGAIFDAALGIVLPFRLASFNLFFIAPIIAEDTAFQGVTLVTLERR
jgi:hypothetical protein